MRSLAIVALVAALLVLANAQNLRPFPAKVHILSEFGWSSNTYYPRIAFNPIVAGSSLSTAFFPGYDTDDLSNATVSLGLMVDTTSGKAYAGFDALVFDEFFGGVTPTKGSLPGVDGIPQNMVTVTFELDTQNPNLKTEIVSNPAYSLKCSETNFVLPFAASKSIVCKDPSQGPVPPNYGHKQFSFAVFWAYDS